MADEKEFDRSAAASRQDDLLQQVIRLRDGINTDVINYYYDRKPGSDAEERTNRAGIRKYLQVASARIDDILNNS